MKRVFRGLLSGFVVLTMLCTLLVGPVSAAEQKQPRVMVNGQFMTFDDAQPTNVGGRIMVPLRKLFEGLGWTVSFENNRATAILGDKTVTCQPGDQTLTMTQNGESKTVELDQAPFIDAKSGRTFVSARFLAEALGYSVSWDGKEDTVVLIDTASLLDGLNETYSILNKTMAKSYDAASAYESNCNFDVKMSIKDEGLSIDLVMLMAMNMLQKGNLADMDMNLQLSGIPSMAGVDPAVLEALEDITFSYRMDLDEGVMYLNSSIFDLTPVPLKDGSFFDGNTWLKMDIGSLYDSMGLNWNMLLASVDMAQNPTIEDVLGMYLNLGGQIATVDTYQEMQAILAMLEQLVGDGAFRRVSVANGVETYKWELTPARMKAALSAAEKLWPEAGKADFAQMQKDLGELMQNMNMTWTLQLRAGSYISSTADMSMTIPVPYGDDLVMTMKMKDSGLTKSEIEMTMTSGELITLTMDGEITITKTDKTPIAKPDDGAKVIDFMDLIMAFQ